jgi:hypothetical protein
MGLSTIYCKNLSALFLSGVLVHWQPMPKETCNHGKTAPQSVLDDLPHSQAGTGRHKCAVCAYQLGFEAGLAAMQAAQTSEPESVTQRN